MAQPLRGKPRSKSDWARELYDNTIQQEVDAAPVEQMRRHPDLAESSVPIWGPAREATADLYDGDYLGAVVNAGLAVADGFGGPSIARAAWQTAAKTAAKATAPASAKMAMKKASEIGKGGKMPYAWRYARERMVKADQFLKPYQAGHHWAVPQRATWLPDKFKNQRWNIKPMPEGEVGREAHGLIHGPYKGQPRYNPIQRYIEGTPTWWKATNLAAGHAAGAAKAEWDKSK